MTSRHHAPAATPQRDTYRHGDLRQALLAAGVALAREGGPGAIVLREATRRVGVAPNAAYRHFANHAALFEAVRAHAVRALALATEREMAKARREPEPVERARALLRAVGAAYLGFAQTETGLFRTAFMPGWGRAPASSAEAVAASAGDSGRNPFELLGDVLDALVQAGALPAERRPQAEYLAWATVHGMALLVIDGPLQRATAAEREALSQRLLAMVENGL